MTLRNRCKKNFVQWWSFKKYRRPVAIHLQKVDIHEAWHADWCAIYQGRKCSCYGSMHAPLKCLRANKITF
jgi:hypothetical protein